MTRYTNFGRKRTHVEAGFADGFADDAPAEEGSEYLVIEDTTTLPEIENNDRKQNVKKDKKAKHKKAKRDTETNCAEDVRSSLQEDKPDRSEHNEEVEMQAKNVASAYNKKNREKLRRGPFVFPL